jgi:hypothetical protein
MTNTSALVAPAVSRSTAHTASFCVTGISAKVATSTINDVRRATAERTNAGTRIPADAPAR